MFLSILLHVLQPTRFNLSIYLSIYPSKIVSHTTRFYCLSIYVYFTLRVSMYLSILLRVFHSTYLGVLIYLSFYDCVSLCSHNLSPDVSERVSAILRIEKNAKTENLFPSLMQVAAVVNSCHTHTTTLTHWQIRVSRQVQDSKKLVIFCPPRGASQVLNGGPGLTGKSSQH